MPFLSYSVTRSNSNVSSEVVLVADISSFLYKLTVCFTFRYGPMCFWIFTIHRYFGGWLIRKRWNDNYMSYFQCYYDRIGHLSFPPWAWSQRKMAAMWKQSNLETFGRCVKTQIKWMQSFANCVYWHWFYWSVFLNPRSDILYTITSFIKWWNSGHPSLWTTEPVEDAPFILNHDTITWYQWPCLPVKSSRPVF